MRLGLPTPSLPTSRLPISVLTGFLGSGKTSLLARVLADPDFADTVVMINEFGTIGLDHLLLEAADGAVVAMPSGCLCCVLRQDLADTLYGLLRRRASGDLPPFRRIVVETSGLAEPAPILSTLSADAFLEQALALNSVVTMIDAVAGLDTLDRFTEAREQAALADRLLISKTDLAPTPTALLDRLAALNPLATIDPSTTLPPSQNLFGAGRPALPRTRFTVTSHTEGIHALAIILDRPMTRLGFAIALGGLAQAHGADLLRVKGLVAFADRAGGPAAIHAVQHTMYPPEWLPDWPDADRRSRLVFIVRDLDDTTILDRFAAGETRPAHSEETVTGEN